MMYDFYIYSGKASHIEHFEYNNLAKSVQVVATFGRDLPSKAGSKDCFDNWFSTSDLMHYLKDRGILAIGTTRANRLQKCPLASNNNL